MKDLFVLTADKNAHFTLKGALKRYQSLGIRPIEFEFLVHPGRDGGVRTSGPEMAGLKRRQFSHALVVLDFEGSGADCANAVELEKQLDKRLQAAWGTCAKAIAIDPEVDVWMWGSDNLIAQAIAWSGESRIREWLCSRNFEMGTNAKPSRPKEALEAVLRAANVRRSSSLYENIASLISIKRCADPAARRLQEQLRTWFPATGQDEVSTT
jgi:hypothetical protein